MTEDLLDAAIDFVIETTGYVITSIGAGPNNQDSWNSVD